MHSVTFSLRPAWPWLALVLPALGCERQPEPLHSETVAPSFALPAPADPAARPAQRETEGWIGVVLAREAVEVAAAFAGRLETVEVRVGDTVRRGDRLARIATDSQRQELVMAEASLQAGEAEVARAQAELVSAEERLARRLQSLDLFSKEEIANAQLLRSTAAIGLKAAQARVRQLGAHVQQLRVVLSQAEVRAPFDGTVALRYADPGTVVGADTPIIKLISRDSLLVRFAVPPDQAALLRAGQTVSVQLDDIGLRMRGTIERISPEIDGASQMIVAEARLESGSALGSRLKTGLVANVSPVGVEAREERETK